MAATASEIIGKLMDALRTVAKTETILGHEIKVGDFTLIPVSKISLGFGAGGGKGTDAKKEGEGGGGGGGVCVTPVAFVVIKGGEISFHGLRRHGPLGTLVEQIPELVEKFMSQEEKIKVKPEEPAVG